MATATNGDVSLHYGFDDETIGSDGETLVFVNDVGLGAWVWGWQHAGLATTNETLVWDLRGTGRSDCPAGPYDVATLAGDLEAVLADAGVASAHLVGAGLGGMIAVAYAHQYSRAESLALLGTAASGDEVTDRLADLRAAPEDEAALRRSLDAVFAADLDLHPDVVEEILDWRRTEDASLAGWDAQAAAMGAFDAPPLYEVTVPALVVHGTGDVLVPSSAGQSLAEALPRGEFQAVDAGHCCYVEDSGVVTDLLVDHVDDAV